MAGQNIDIHYDVRTDSYGRDPDCASARLKRYHKLLLSKNLPDGRLFDLEDSADNNYLFHQSELGEFHLSSDSIIHTYKNWKRTEDIINQVAVDEMKRFYNIAHTVGGYIIFPGNRIDGYNTINQERGMNKKSMTGQT